MRASALTVVTVAVRVAIASAGTRRLGRHVLGRGAGLVDT